LKIINTSNKLSANQLPINKINLNEFKNKLIVNPSSSGILERKIKNRIISDEINNNNDITNNNNRITYKNLSKKIIQNEGLPKANKMNDSLSRKQSSNLRYNNRNEISIYDSTNSNHKKHKYVI